MENRALLLAAAALVFSLVLFPGCIAHKEGFVNGTTLINGSAQTQNMDRYVIEAGKGTNPASWTMLGVVLVNGGSASREETLLGELNTSMLDEGKYTIRLTVTDDNGVSSEDRVYVNVDNIPDAQTRTCPAWTCGNLDQGANNVELSISADQYGSNMDCSVDCACPAGTSMGIPVEVDIEYGYDYLRFGSENVTGSGSGLFGPYNGTTKIRFTSDRSLDGSTGYGGFNITGIVCTRYCISSANYGGEYISRVALGTGERTSDESTYSNYESSVLTELLRGHTYTLYVDITSEYEGSYEYVKAWIDYNLNGVFNDSGEEIDMGLIEVNDTYRYSRTFTVPSNAALGRTVMRVSDRWIAEPTPCRVTGYGEVEDYAIDLVNSLTSTTSSTTSTTLEGDCSMPGDYQPCGQVSMSEVIAHINKWGSGTAQLGDVIALINAWSQGE